MQTIAIILISILISFLTATDGRCQQKCVNAEGEAAIVNNDIPSAKLESIARAKWSAIELVVGVNVMSGSFVQNFVLFDDVINTQAGGVVKSYNVTHK